MTAISNEVDLVPVEVASRSFLLQFFSIMQEFGTEIPWLRPLHGIAYATNTTYFRDQMLLRMGIDEGDVFPYQVLTRDGAREYVAGILHFTQSPERFIDPVHVGLCEYLKSERYQYISCLQVRTGHRGVGMGDFAIRSALNVILARHERVWGVVAHRELLDWYVKLGATVLSPTHNKDNLWIISWRLPGILDPTF